MDQEDELLDSADTPIGLLYLMRYRAPFHPDGWVYEVNIEGELLMSSISPLSERELATQAIAAHPGKRLRILVGGLGLGYTAQAALESDRAALVRVIDPMDFVMDWLRRGLLPLSEQLNGDARLELVQSDVYADLMGPATEPWDVILVDVDHAPDMPLSPKSLPFYTVEGQAKVQQHLAPGGVLGVWSAFPNQDFADVMGKAYSKAWCAEVAWVAAPDTEEEQPLRNMLFLGRMPAAR